jgi:hypothetical protein
MKRYKNWLAGLIAIVMLSTFVFSSSMVLASDEEEQENPSDETVSDQGSDLGGYKGLVAHWKFDGNLEDSTQFNNDGIAVGGSKGVTFTQGVSGQGVKLDGKSYIKVKDSDSLDLTNKFSFSFWVYKDEMRKNDAMDGGVPYIIKNPEPYGDIPYAAWEWFELTPGVTFADDSTSYEVNSDKKVDINKWTMISVTYDGETMKIFRNKELVKSELVSVNLIRTSQPLYIGFGHFMTVDNYFKGVLDDMKIYNTDLTYSEVEGLYDEVTKGIGPGKYLVNKQKSLVAYYKFENDLKDISGYNNNGVAIKASNFKYVNGIAGKAVKFNGSSYIEVKDSDSLDLDKGFTIAGWIYMDKSSKNQPIFSKYGSSNERKTCSYQLINWIDSTPRLSLSDFDKDGEINDFEIDSNSQISNGRWYYYTAAYNGAEDEVYEDEAGIKSDPDTNTVKIYINGKLVSSSEFYGDLSNSSGPLWIGGTTDSTYFKGMMDELRIYNYGLTSTDVMKLYNYRDGLEVLSADKTVNLSSLKAKQSVQLKVNLKTFETTTAKVVDITSKATYKSNNPKVATVSKTGKITTTGKGNATMTVTYGNYTKSVNIAVK